MGAFSRREVSPVVVYGVDSSTKVEAEHYLNTVQDLGQVVPVFVSAADMENPLRFSGCSMFVMMGWNALEHEVRILQEFRKASPHIPIIVHGRRNDPQIRMEAFVQGADNFVSSDCPSAEIHAKIQRLWRLAHTKRDKESTIEVHGLEVWPEEKVVLKEGRRVQLSKRELDMLVCLAKKHPQAVSRQTLEREVFGCRADPGTNVVAVHMHRLRKKISANGKLLRTVPGGYRLTWLLGITSSQVWADSISLLAFSY
ncbi:response regulator transcription factor [Sinisalibacter aestuarii]|uniref:OmpR/PhoB-type domain-containing protein n=1 Tax=Sinisalibacter aestuarii TaxID=2949426 RepID=A0ABQ5LW56_9RHOB|nr:response regulator transcription factor [Sinisalibacter aestuarii]GKY89224.1 hypothetical protein STA1M1_30930 [Sinisalibacter aestuarii]